MIQSTQDLADALIWGATHSASVPETTFSVPSDEAKFGEPVTTSGIVPQQTVFTVTTVEDRHYTVTITDTTHQTRNGR